MKVCSTCKKTLELVQFSRDSRTKDQLRSRCKACDSRAKRGLNAVLYNIKGDVITADERRESIRATSLRYRKTKRAQNLVRQAKRRALDKDLPYDLDDYVDDIQARIDQGVCELTGAPLDFTRSSHRSPSLDRLVPSTGYVYSNIRVVCYGINCAMGDWGEDALMEMVKSWIEKDNKK